MINVLISVNHSYLPHAQVMLKSLISNTKEKVSVYLLNHELGEEDVSWLDAWVQSQKCALHAIDVSQTDLDGLPTCPGQFSIEMYYRIIAQYILPAHLDRVLWLDSDIVILKDLSSFYHQDFDNNCLVACPDRNAYSDFIDKIKKKVGIGYEHVYFNSGVLLLNLELLRNTYSLLEISSAIVSMQDSLTYPDQDFLNYAYQGKVKYCDWRKYNYQINLDRHIRGDRLRKISVLHYTGFHKPWLYRYLSSLSIYYWRTARILGREGEFKSFLIKGILFWPVEQIRELPFRLKSFLSRHFVSYLKKRKML